MKYYKVLYRLKNGCRFSPNVADDRFKLIYKLNKINKPKIKNSKLFVYSDLDRANSFYKACSNEACYNKSIACGVELWEVECGTIIEIINSRFPALWSTGAIRLSIDKNTHSNLYKFLSDAWLNINDSAFESGHIDTKSICLTDSIKLAKLLKSDNFNGDVTGTRIPQ